MAVTSIKLDTAEGAERAAGPEPVRAADAVATAIVAGLLIANAVVSPRRSL